MAGCHFESLRSPTRGRASSAQCLRGTELPLTHIGVKSLGWLCFPSKVQTGHGKEGKTWGKEFKVFYDLLLDKDLLSHLDEGNTILVFDHFESRGGGQCMNARVVHRQNLFLQIMILFQVHDF